MLRTTISITEVQYVHAAKRMRKLKSKHIYRSANQRVRERFERSECGRERPSGRVVEI